MTKHETDLTSYWRWKAVEGRLVAGRMSDPAARLALLKIAEIYERMARCSERSWRPPPAGREDMRTAA